MSKPLLVALAVLSFAGAAEAQAPAAPANPPAPRARGPAAALAVEAAQTAVAACLASTYKVTALIVDSAGVPVILLSGDGAAERTQMIAGTKVAAVLKYKISSGEVVAKAKTDQALADEIKADPKIGTARQGAIPITVDGQLIGAFAVSGAPGGDKDEVCARAGLEKIAGRLK